MEVVMKGTVYFDDIGEEPEADRREGKVSCTLDISDVSGDGTGGAEYDIRFREPQAEEGVPRIALMRNQLIAIRDGLTDALKRSDGIKGLKTIPPG